MVAGIGPALQALFAMQASGGNPQGGTAAATQAGGGVAGTAAASAAGSAQGGFAGLLGNPSAVAGISGLLPLPLQYFGAQILDSVRSDIANVGQRDRDLTLRQLLGAVTPHQYNSVPGLDQFAVQNGSPEAQFLPVGTLLPGASALGQDGLSQQVFDVRQLISNMLANPLLNESDLDRFSNVANRAVGAEQDAQPEPQSLTDLAGRLSDGGLGSAGTLGATTRMQNLLQNAAYRRQTQQFGNEFLQGLFGIAGQVV